VGRKPATMYDIVDTKYNDEVIYSGYVYQIAEWFDVDQPIIRNNISQKQLREGQYRIVKSTIEL
jgi:hypothetical protein